jgi:hypothetical protein
VTVLPRPVGSGLRAASPHGRALTIAIFSLPLLLVMAASVRAQAPAAPRPTPHQRPANAQDMFGWLRQLAPTQRRQSRAVSSPPLPRPRPAGLTAPMRPSPTSKELEPADLEPSQPPTEVSPPDEPNEGPLND